MQKRSVLDVAVIVILVFSLIANMVLLSRLNHAANAPRPTRVVVDSYNDKQVENLLNAAMEARHQQLKDSLQADYAELRKQKNALRAEERAVSDMLRTGKLDKNELKTHLDKIHSLQCTSSETTQRITYSVLTQLSPEELVKSAQKPKRGKGKRPVREGGKAAQKKAPEADTEADSDADDEDASDDDEKDDVQ